MNAIKNILKVLTSGELIAILDTNEDGRVSWKEIKTAPLSVWFEIGIKYIPYALIFLL